MQTGVTGASKEIFVVDFDRTGVTGANKEIFVVDFDTLFTIGSEIFISLVLPLWQGHRIDAQCTHDYKIDSPSTEEVPHQDTPTVQPPPQKMILAALSKEPEFDQLLSERSNVMETSQSWRRCGSACAELHAQLGQVQLNLVKAQMLCDKVCRIFSSCDFSNCKLLFSHLLLHPEIPNIEMSKLSQSLPAHDAERG